MGESKIHSFSIFLIFSYAFRAVKCDTVFFTNSQSRLENLYNVDGNSDNIKSYQLDVPGSSPVTIIETDSLKGDVENSRYAKVLYDDDSKKYNERRTKDYIVPGSTHEGDDAFQFNGDRCHGEFCNDSKDNGKTVYSPDLLNKFLQEYAERIKNADQKTKEKLHKMEITTTKDNYVSEGNYEKKKVTEKVNIQIQKDGNRRYWDENDSKKHKHPYDDPDGWVALEAVPWSKSKISKWQANAQKVSKPSNTYNSFDEDEVVETNYNDRYSTYGKPEQDNHKNTYQYTTRPFKYSKPHSDENPFDDEWVTNAPPKPSWPKPPKNRPSYNINNGYDADKRPQHKPDCNHTPDDEIDEYDGYNRRVSNSYYEKDIIVDDRPSDFPQAQEYTMSKNYNKKHEVEQNDFRKFRHPVTYPSNGNGQWVLLSTTKGYKYPKHRERSLSLLPSPLTARRSVRLTVLPAVDGSKENMTLSHGGLLEVEPSFETVEESKRIYERIRAINNSTVKKRPSKSNIVATNATPDASAVVAAVGAGLVPATVAMIMPMVLGRKKRSTLSLRNPFTVPNVTQVPHFDYESSLQKTM